MSGNFQDAYMYPVLVLRMQCSNGGIPPIDNIIQYAFGQYDDFDWNNAEVSIDDTQARLMLESLEWTDINRNHYTFRKHVFDNNEGMYRNYVFETDRLMHSNGVFNIPYQITEVRISNGDDMVTHSYIYRITENVNFEDIQRQWDIIKVKLGPTKENIDDGFLQMFYYALQ